MNISGDVYQRLVKRARNISEMAAVQFCRQAAMGASEQQLIRLLLDLATQKGQVPGSLREIKDDDFVRALTNPTTDIS